MCRLRHFPETLSLTQVKRVLSVLSVGTNQFGVSKAIWHLESAWKKGNHYAGYQLGKLYLYGREVETDQEKAIAYLTASAEMGNQYAGQLLHSIRNNRNWSAATGTLRLLHHISKIIQNRIVDERKGKDGELTGS